MKPASSPPAPWALVAALAAIVILRFTYYGRLALYPFTLFGTWVHEMGHGVTAILVGGHFDRLEIFADGSGLAHSSYGSGIAAPLVALGGLVAPPIVGFLIVASARSPRFGRAILFVLIASIVASIALWVRTPVGVIAMGGLALVLVAFARWLGAGAGLFAMLLLGFALCLDTVNGIDYLFVREALIAGTMHRSDIAGVADGFGGPMLLWSLLVAAFSLAFCGLAALVTYRRLVRAIPDSKN